MITHDVAVLLKDVKLAGQFCASGTIAIHAPHLEVEGVGPVALPLLPYQAEQLAAVAEAAPYGRGTETLVDPAVRRTWQIDARRVRLSGQLWEAVLDEMVARVTEGLGVEGPVQASFYKLLVYDRGCFFVSHRDTEKVDGMFATLVVVLPSLYEGGELVVRHGGQEVRLDLRCADPSEAVFAAFYADCLHEVLPVTDGCRLALIYNLTRAGRMPKVPDHAPEQERLAKALRAWAGALADPPADPPADAKQPDKLVYVLEHAYTPAELSFAALKGQDAARCATLLAAAQKAGCDLSLALFSFTESGAAEEVYSGRHSWRHRGHQEFEAGEVFERSVTVSHWRRPDGSTSDMGDLQVNDEEVSPPGLLDDLDPDEESFSEATGNEGASFERTYQRAALVLWPANRRIAVINQAGLGATLPFLEEIAHKIGAAGPQDDAVSRQEARELSTLMIRTWPRPQSQWESGPPPDHVTKILETLSLLGDGEQIATFVTDVLAEGQYPQESRQALVAALRHVPPDRACDLLTLVIAGNAATRPGACADLLAGAAVAFRPQEAPRPRSRRPAMSPKAAASAPGDHGEVSLLPAAVALVDSLPMPPAAPPLPSPGSWRSPPKLQPTFVADLLTALVSIDQALAHRVVPRMLEHPGFYGADTLLIPALLALRADAQTWGCQAVQLLLASCLEHLRGRTSLSLEPPGDWKRDHLVACKCPTCLELSRFLADPRTKSWVHKAAEASRRHVESTIQQSGCDLDRVTERRGSPHSLVCTKNQASYERRVQQRKQDLENMARLTDSPK